MQAKQVAAVEALITANYDDIEAADRRVEQLVKKVEKTTATKKITADDKSYMASMKRVEDEAKKFVSQRAMAKLDLDIGGAERNLQRAKDRLEDLRIRADAGMDVAADIRRAEAQITKLQKTVTGLTSTRAKLEVEADVNGALRDAQRLTEQIVSRDVAILVNANVASARSDVTRLESDLAQLRALAPTVQVTADIARAESRLSDAADKLQKLEGARATMVVNVATDGAKEDLRSIESIGEEAGDNTGARFGGAVIAALATIPIAGAVFGIGKAVGDALVEGMQDGLQMEAGFDRLAALTGISDSDALRLGRSASEAYAAGFGDSIESNMSTTKLGLQFNLIDDKATTAQAQRVVQGLQGISDVLEEDVKPTATAVTTLLKTGMANSATEAFDLLATGAREGVNRGDDLLDTLTEYPSVLTKLGLSGRDMLGLINQGLDAGARNSDVAADALKEFQIRATDGSESSAAGFERLGLSAEGMTAKIAAGGQGAREGLQEVLTKLREMEDPVQRNAAAVELFGTKAEDLGDALFAMNLDTAVQQLGQVEGAAQRMFDTLADNDAARVEGAFRNIEVAADGLKGMLAAGFSEPLGDAAEFIARNRGPMMQFFIDLANGALNLGEGVVEGTASGTEALGSFVSGPLADFVYSVADILGKLPWPFAQDTSGIKDAVEEMRGFDDQTQVTADTIRELGTGAIEEARAKLNEFGDGAIAMGYLNDASLRLAESLSGVGLAADGTTQLVDAYTIAQDGSVQANAQLSEQIRGAIAAMEDELKAAADAGEGQAALTDRYNAATGALVSQLTQMGLTEDQARALIDTIIQTPGARSTAYSSNADTERGKIDNLALRIDTLPDGTIVIRADDSSARGVINRLVEFANGKTVTVPVRGSANWSGPGHADGGPIVGPGGPREDRVPIWASPGEHMITAAEVDAAGGHASIYAWRRAIASGALRRADGGPIIRASRLPEMAIGAPSPATPAPRVLTPPAASNRPVHYTQHNTFTKADPDLVSWAVARETSQALGSTPV